MPHISMNPWVWSEAIATLAIFTFLWRENPLYRLAEYLFIGLAVGYELVITWTTVLKPLLYEPLVHEHKFILLVPFALMVMTFFRLSSKFTWVSFWPLAFLIGFSGYAIPVTIEANFLTQIQSTAMLSFTGSLPTIIGELIIITGTLASLFYFYFSVPHNRATHKVAIYGSFLLMISFGASFGFTVMARISLLIGRVEYLLKDWLGLIS